jgi:hypothetical protein
VYDAGQFQRTYGEGLPNLEFLQYSLPCVFFRRELELVWTQFWQRNESTYMNCVLSCSDSRKLLPSLGNMRICTSLIHNVSFAGYSQCCRPIQQCTYWTRTDMQLLTQLLLTVVSNFQVHNSFPSFARVGCPRMFHAYHIGSQSFN